MFSYFMRIYYFSLEDRNEDALYQLLFDVVVEYLYESRYFTEIKIYSEISNRSGS